MLGVEAGVKQRANKRLGGLQRKLNMLPQMNGLTRTYRPILDDDPEVLPPEQVRVQIHAEQVIKEVAETMVDLFDVVLTREAGNARATADITVGDVVVARDVPVTYLLFLDKQLQDLITILKAIPVLDPAEEWSYDPQSGAYRTPERGTARSKKVPFPFVKAPATDKHAAQVETLYEDRVVGTWTKVQYSGALPADRIFTLVRRAEALQRAVKSARELANATRIEQKKVGQALFDYVLAP
jgi:hypothetical protein